VDRGIGPAGYTAIALGCFFAAACLICLIAGITILWPSTSLWAIWSIKPDDFAQLLDLAPWSGLGFLLLCVVMGAAAWGCWQRRLWGWRLAVGIFTAHALGDVWQIANGSIAEGVLGMAVLAAILLWLTRARVRSGFH
jgi:hypothetical protein